MTAAGDPSELDAAITSVAAHGMLNALAVARATVSTLRAHWEHLDSETCVSLLGRAEDQLAFLGDLLTDLVRGIPPETRSFLDQLPEERA
jgi:hypothetical protein